MRKKDKCVPERMGTVGGQAVLEGVMMKAGNRSVTTCRKEDGSLVVTDSSFVSVRKKHKILNIPILRGIINFVEMLILSVKTLSASAEALGLEEEEDGKFAKWLKKHFGATLTDFVMLLGVILGVALSLFLFMYLPNLIGAGINALSVLLFGFELGVWLAVIEGVVKVVIFLTYLYLVSLMPDIKRTFMYHGAEHKTIACFEAGEELTPENAARHRRFHPRCGTSFMFFMILLGIFAGVFVRLIIPTGLPTIAYTGIRILILPLIVGIGYEFIMFAGKHDNFFTRFFSTPGLWVQRLTTKEPTEDMLEVAIISTKCALRDKYPEFMEFFEARSWEKAEAAEGDTAAEEATEAEQGESEQSAPAEGAAVSDTPATDTPASGGDNAALGDAPLE